MFTFLIEWATGLIKCNEKKSYLREDYKHFMLENGKKQSEKFKTDWLFLENIDFPPLCQRGLQYSDLTPTEW